MKIFKCKWCGVTVPGGEFDDGEKECNSCWELRYRIEDNITLAQKILYKLLGDRFDALTKEE